MRAIWRLMLLRPRVVVSDAAARSADPFPGSASSARSFVR
jgi:hypothetical protein